MKLMNFAALVLLVLPVSGLAGEDIDQMGMTGADVIILGEVHDNPRHHQVQASLVAGLAPTALVFEMLSADQATQITDENRLDEGTLGAALGWDQTGWPDFTLYFPIFAAAPDARVYGAGVTREVARTALKSGITIYFGAQTGAYGLDQPLGEAELAERLEFQSDAHCGALPDTMLPTMVGLQRLRDAVLARTVVSALAETGGPVVVITGNGHARKDWGLAAYLDRARPDLKVFALGQSEDGQIEGVFDKVLDAPAVQRPDPCLEFEKQG